MTASESGSLATLALPDPCDQFKIGTLDVRSVLGAAMQVSFSTEHIAPRDRVRCWCDYFAKQAHSITPGEVPDPGAFRAEASGSIAGKFALLDIKSELERVQRTAADVAKDKSEAFF